MNMKVEDWVFSDDGLPTHTSEEQRKVEESMLPFFDAVSREGKSAFALNKDKTIEYLQANLEGLSEMWACLDASRPWLVYWMVHSLAMMGVDLSYLEDRVCDFLGRCQSEKGGFAGGPGQDPHLATTYAAVMALATIGTPKAYHVVDRKRLHEFFMTIKQPNGGFVMHVGGEQDVRGTYCCLAAATLLNIVTPQLVLNTDKYLAALQSHEGGLGGEPGNEAHGGYTFCGFAALVLMDKASAIDLKSLFKWAARRQMSFEGGFQGRSNKLVDGCYSYWQGGIFPLLRQALEDEGMKVDTALFASEMLERYILLAAQSPSGGLRDKPRKSRDFYHTCYNLSGLAICQHFGYKTPTDCLGGPDNLLERTNPVLNILASKADEMLSFFADKPFVPI